MIGNFIYSLNPLALGALVIGAHVGFILLIVFLSLKCIPRSDLKAVEFKVDIYSDRFIAAISIFLSFMIVNEWSSYTAFRQSMRAEISNLHDMHQFTPYCSPELRQEIHDNLNRYIKHVIQEELSPVHKGDYVKPTENYLVHIYGSLNKSYNNSGNQGFVCSHLSSLITDTLQHRRERLFQSETSLSFMMWFVVIACDVISLLMLSLSISDSLRLSRVLLSLFGLGMGLMVLLILLLDNPLYYAAYFGDNTPIQSFSHLLELWPKNFSTNPGP